jgi:hypothetical protein
MGDSPVEPYLRPSGCGKCADVEVGVKRTNAWNGPFICVISFLFFAERYARGLLLFS